MKMTKSHLMEKFYRRPSQYVEGWTGPDVWHAHCVKLDGQEIDLFSKSETGVAPLPRSNCRLDQVSHP
jgi:cytosine/adenosine deaminase-related metal-dependent hydrolase